jgi:hypothetical protein
MIFVPWLVDAARATGYRVVEVDGWRTRGHGAMRLVEGVVGHHTGTPASAPGDYPSLNVVINGRSDLAGPLCNLGLGRDGTIYVVAAGCAWHAGASAWAGFLDVNDEFLGIEAESAGTGVWTAAQRDAYPKLVGTLLRYMTRAASRYAGHKDVCLPVGRKIDPVGIDTVWMQQVAAPYVRSRSTREGDDVTTTQDYPPTYEDKWVPETVDGKPTGALVPSGKLTTRLHILTMPVGVASEVVQNAWLSFKCGGAGPGAEYVRLMSIRSDGSPAGPNYAVDQEFANVRPDHARPWIKAADGQDQFTVMVRSAHPYSLAIEIEPK